MDPLTPSINDDELIDFDEIEETSDTVDLQQQQFCIKLLCEYEGVSYRKGFLTFTIVIS